MRKFISGVLSAAVLAGMLTFGGTAATDNKALMFDDTVFKEAGGTHGYASADVATDPDLTAISMDFTFGHADPCIHPVDPLLYHSSKLNITIGSNGRTYKYFGYNATEDFFYLARSGMYPNSGETKDGYEYLATSESGLIRPGETHKLAIVLSGDFQFNMYLDGECIIDFNLDYDMLYADYFTYGTILIYPTHICCFIDNLAVYDSTSNYDPEDGTGTPISFTDFENTKVEVKDVVDEDGNVTGSGTFVSSGDWGFGKSDEQAYSAVTIEDSVYGQPQTPAAEGQPVIVFENDVDSSSGMDFEAALTIENNPGFTSLSMELLNDDKITVNEFVPASGLSGEIKDGVLTITASANYTGTELGTMKYTMATEAVQDFLYGYGAKISSIKGIEGATVAIGMTEVYNYTVGDLDGDGRCTTIDVELILKIAQRWDLPGVFAEAGDVNGDGRTNSMDATYMLRCIAGWKDYQIKLG